MIYCYLALLWRAFFLSFVLCFSGTNPIFVIFFDSRLILVKTTIQVKADIRNPLRYSLLIAPRNPAGDLPDSVKKSVDLRPQIVIFRKWLKMGKKRSFENGDRPTFLRKSLQKWGGWGIIAVTNGGNAVVVPYLWGIDTYLGAVADTENIRNL